MNETVRINLHPLGKQLDVKKDTPLIDVLNEFGIEFPCGGKGTCGRCRIKILEGHLEAGTVHQEKLKRLKLADQWRLACYCSADSDVTIEVAQFENIILADDIPFAFEPKEGYGIAVDVGTTTLVVQLLDLKTGRLIDSESALNPQSRFGSDLISRIQSCLDGNRHQLAELVRSTIGRMIQDMLHRHPVTVHQIVLVGNTPMHHIFSNLDVRPLSFYPFESTHCGSRCFDASELTWDFLNESDICFYPSIGSFVGSDILAGIAACGMTERDEYTVLIDLGTNGEVVAGNRERIICASTAAGPAFEGARISQGMRAVTGAVSSFYTDGNQIGYHVIGNVNPRGICGSGLIDAIALLTRQQEIGIFGELLSGDARIELAPGIFLTQQDIREFQLAKAAVAAGIQILLNRLDITSDDVAQVYLAGGFGNFVNVNNIVQTGLLEFAEDKILKMGNTALTGAKMFLFRDNRFIQNILDKTQHINLEGDTAFQDIYVDKMIFPGV